jgi:hypothetical protein
MLKSMAVISNDALTTGMEDGHSETWGPSTIMQMREELPHQSIIELLLGIILIATLFELFHLIITFSCT